MSKKEDVVKKAINEIEYKKQASAAFVDGIISFFIFPLIFGIIAIVRANIALHSKEEETIKKARTGKTLGIVSLVVRAVLFLIYAIFTTLATMH